MTPAETNVNYMDTVCVYDIHRRSSRFSRAACTFKTVVAQVNTKSNIFWMESVKVETIPTLQSMEGVFTVHVRNAFHTANANLEAIRASHCP